MSQHFVDIISQSERVDVKVYVMNCMFYCVIFNFLFKNYDLNIYFSNICYNINVHYNKNMEVNR